MPWTVSIMLLNLFDVPEVDYRYEGSRDVVFEPALTGIQPITFSIPASDDYYDLNELRFQVKMRLTDPASGYQGLKANLAISDAKKNRQYRYAQQCELEWQCRIAFLDEPVARPELAHLHHPPPFATPQDG